ncbi:MAG: YqgE/AlgH family protein [Sphingomonadales bacterium]|nr:YqgE/AlgH family protein [Sphingomonadaceae bacterium]MBS3932375.1 YqgE/AlgH family protein [Sphingomonadales bacterium]
MEAAYLTGKLLLAMPGMADPRFDHAVIAMVNHDAEGALGVGIGAIRQGPSLHAMLRELEIEPGQAPDCPIHYGGPVEVQRGFVLHTPDWEGPGTIEAAPLCSLSTSLEVLKAIAAGEGPSRFLVALGYAGWGAGQLDGEMRRHGWQVVDGSQAMLWDTPAEARWKACWRTVGIDPALLASQTGRA